MLSDLYSFYCAGNVLITGLNLTNNTVLDTLDCANCDINSLNLNTNTLLTTLTCQSNQLTSLDVSQNTALTKLYCHTNSITNLDVSMLTSLDWFRCEVNGMLTLNIANGNNANMPANKFDARQYPDPTTLVITCDTPANPHAVYTVAAGCITNGTTFN
jgi:Leucine-rich repeat (LRR) protein